MLGFALLSIVFVDQFHYLAYRWSWPVIASTVAADKQLTLLLVGDPQLIGYQTEKYQWLARWDSDR